MQTRYVNTASSPGGTGEDPGTSGSTRAWASIDEAMVALEDIGTLSDAYTIYCTGSTADTVARSINVDLGTSATNYVLFTTQGADRPGTSWSTSKYRLSLTNADSPFYLNAANHVRIDGLQMEMTATVADEYILIKPSNANQTGNGKDLRVSNCLIRGHVTTGTIVGIECRPFGSGTGTVKVWNNIVYDCTSGIRCESGGSLTPEVYNNTVYNCEYNIYANSTNACVAKNNLSASGNTTDFLAGGSFAAGSSNNASSDGSAPGTSSRTSQTFTFVSAGTDFALQSSDAGAKDFGVSDPGSGLFSNDILGNTRSGSWDIGAHEYGAGAGAGGSVHRLMTLGVGL